MFRFNNFGKGRGTRSASLEMTSNGGSDSSVRQAIDNGDLFVPPIPTTRDLSKAEYTKRAQALLELHTDLENLGASAVFDVPKIVVIGNQSAGKSSLIEAVTGINVPRDSGACTRCPMYCIMKNTQTAWSCTIFLRVAYGPDGVKMDDSHVRNQQFGTSIVDKSQVELWLRRAQAAILSPNPDKSQWLTKSQAEISTAFSEPHTKLLSFTKNTIRVEIEGQNLTNLSFVDLPGLIHNAKTEAIDTVKELVLEHIQRENTLILVTLPVIDDISIHGAMKLANDVDPLGKRTIGVLTKPDRLGEGDTGLQDACRALLENRPGSDNHLRHGYYCVRLPDDHQRQRGLDVHALDSDFFNTTRPWNQITNRNRFNVSNLVDDISALLIRLIEANVPKIRTAVEKALAECNNRLSELPPLLTSEPMVNILLMVNAFLRDTRQAIAGELHKQLAQQCRERYTTLQQEILEKSPEFIRPPSGVSSTNILSLDDVLRAIRESTGWELPGCIPYDAVRDLILRLLRQWKNPADSCFDDIVEIFSSFIEELAEKHFGNYQSLKNSVINQTRAQLEECKQNAREYTDALLAIGESKKLFTQRGDFSTRKASLVQSYRSSVSMSYRGIQGHEQAIEVMALVKAYWDVAYDRFIDIVPLMQEHQMIHTLPRKLESRLLDHFAGPQSTQILSMLAAEDLHVAQERQKLTTKRQRLQELKKRLDDFNLSEDIYMNDVEDAPTSSVIEGWRPGSSE